MRVAGHIFGVVNGEFLVLAKSGRDNSIDDDEWIDKQSDG